MKFIQLLSTIASLAIFATAPGVSAAGLRAAGVDNGEDPSSGRRSLYVKHHGRPGTVKGMPGNMGLPDNMGFPSNMGVPANFNHNYEAKYYNQMYNNGHGGSYYEGDGGDYAYPAYHGYEAYASEDQDHSVQSLLRGSTSVGGGSDDNCCGVSLGGSCPAGYKSLNGSNGGITIGSINGKQMCCHNPNVVSISGNIPNCEY